MIILLEQIFELIKFIHVNWNWLWLKRNQLLSSPALLMASWFLQRSSAFSIESWVFAICLSNFSTAPKKHQIWRPKWLITNSNVLGFVKSSFHCQINNLFILGTPAHSKCSIQLLHKFFVQNFRHWNIKFQRVQSILIMECKICKTVFSWNHTLPGDE